MKVSVSLPHEDVKFLDAYVHEHGVNSRSAALHRAVEMLRAAQLHDAYADAWREWGESGEAEMWENTSGDGLAR